MPDSAVVPRLDQKHIDQLACPACHQPLTLEADSVLCTACQRSYPITDGIPILLAKRNS
jgi:uncharacterized protein YbaR (Trm112 family)